MRGTLITFEGMEGSGKTTQIDLLADCLQNSGRQIQKFREPGGTPVGEKIRDLLLHPDGDVERLTELFLFEAARHQLVVNKIRPALLEGCVVLLDRFYDATAAYQGYGRGLPLDWIDQLTRYACGDIVPHLSILLDIEPEKGLERCLKRAGKEYAGADRIEASGLEFLRRVRDGYLEIAKREAGRFAIVRVTDDVESTFSQVIETVRKRTILLPDL